MAASTGTPPQGLEAFFWTAFKRSKSPMALLDEHRRFVEVNAATERVFGYSRNELLGSRPDQFFASRSLPKVEQDWRELWRTGRFCSDRHFIRRDGKEVVTQFALQLEVVTGRHLVLWVSLEHQLVELHRRGRRSDASPLTPRELEVISLISLGLRVHEIAPRLFITEATVRTHVRKAMAKVGARSQAQLVAIAIATGQLDGRAVGVASPS